MQNAAKLKFAFGATSFAMTTADKSIFNAEIYILGSNNSITIDTNVNMTDTNTYNWTAIEI